MSSYKYGTFLFLILTLFCGNLLSDSDVENIKGCY